jgi:capsular exopolysaccharide synthesis family protein
MTQTGRKVLLVDADWRKPKLHKTLQVSREPGIVDWIEDAESPDLSLNACLRETEIPGLMLMPAGRDPEDAAGQLVYSKRLLELLRGLRTGFDVVLIDTAPALHFADARQLGRQSDGLVLVVRAGTTFREGAQRLQGQLRGDGVQLLGTVLNDWRADEGRDEFYAKQYQAYVRASSSD